MVKNPLLDEPMPFVMPAGLTALAARVYTLMMRNMNQKQIKADIGLTTGAMRRVLKDNGWHIPREMGNIQLWRACERCGEQFPLRGPANRTRFCSKLCNGQRLVKTIQKQCVQCLEWRNIRPCHDRNNIYTCSKSCGLLFRTTNQEYKLKRDANVRAGVRKKWSEELLWAQARRMELSENSAAYIKQYSDTNPSSAEQACHSILNALGIAFETQYGFVSLIHNCVKRYDVFLPAYEVLIEVHGTFHHADPRKYPDRSKLTQIQRKNVANDLIKAAIAEEEMQKKLVVIWEHDLHAAPLEVAKFILALKNIKKAPPKNILGAP